MPTNASNVCLSGKTGSDEQALKTTLFDPTETSNANSNSGASHGDVAL
jgi:hypothetical protein